MWRRALAFLIDLALLGILVEIENQTGFVNNIFSGIINFLLIITYFTYMDYYFGGSLGKRLVGLRVALPSSPGVLGNLILRAFVKIISLTPPITIIYGLVAIWRKDGRSLADFASGSTVVELPLFTPPKQSSAIERVCASILLTIFPWILMAILMIFCFSLMIAENWDKLSPLVQMYFERH
jgi:uncharacterized RDD family membrane protein YckC